ncbi:MAG: glycine cleavage system protein H [Denitrovibrio sp.]|nr:MAG: glycine cleavage system protein H [Denitrovibrio sp.]
MSIFYTKEHEWIKVVGDKGTIGISTYAADQLGDITFVELPEVGDEIEKGEIFCSVESVKAASDIYAPMSGVITDINDELESAPETVNDSAEDTGWIAKITIIDIDEEELLTTEEYDAYIETLD